MDLNVTYIIGHGEYQDIDSYHIELYDMSINNIIYFRKVVLTWSTSNLRHFYWREHKLDPFLILVTEILLEKTPAVAVDRIIPVIFNKYPNVESMCAADLEYLEQVLRPLGLYKKRAKALIDISKIMMKELHIDILKNFTFLISLPFVGRYVANAVLCFAFDQRRAIVDSNILRLYTRYFGLPQYHGKISENDELWIFATKILPRKNARRFNWALLDIAGTICTKRSMQCTKCPIRNKCYTNQLFNDE